jgi:hypothetical protein
VVIDSVFEGDSIIEFELSSAVRFGRAADLRNGK